MGLKMRLVLRNEIQKGDHLVESHKQVPKTPRGRLSDMRTNRLGNLICGFDQEATVRLSGVCWAAQTEREREQEEGTEPEGREKLRMATRHRGGVLHLHGRR